MVSSRARLVVYLYLPYICHVIHIVKILLCDCKSDHSILKVFPLVQSFLLLIKLFQGHILIMNMKMVLEVQDFYVYKGDESTKGIKSLKLFVIRRVEICSMGSLRYHLIDIEEAIKLPVLICSRNMLQNGRGEKRVS